MSPDLTSCNKCLHLIQNKFILFVEQTQIRVDEVEVVLGRDVVTATKLVLEVSTIDSHGLLHRHYMTHHVLTVDLRYQWILFTR